MWKCKHCGSDDIFCDGVGNFIAEGRLDDNGNLDTSTIDFGNIQIDEYEVSTMNYWCNNCGKQSMNIDELVEWIDD